MSIRHLALALAACTALTACGQAAQLTSARPASAKNASASGIAPDSARILAEDTARATYWQPDAVRVMALRSTRLNTTALSSTANVFYSADAAADDKPALLIARHTGVASAAKFYEERLYTEVAASLAPIGDDVTVTADQALQTAQQALAPAGSAAGAKATIFSSNAFLVADEAGPKWVLTAGSRQVVVHAQTRAVLQTAPRPKLNQYYNQDFALELQRAAATWLP